MPKTAGLPSGLVAAGHRASPYNFIARTTVNVVLIYFAWAPPSDTDDAMAKATFPHPECSKTRLGDRGQIRKSERTYKSRLG